ncbi:MAG: hypothetical protein JOZ41_13375, partial [Chloroflexi bacterium]|nr:hypothetical protein [Chloroflexota bacterium]
MKISRAAMVRLPSVVLIIAALVLSTRATPSPQSAASRDAVHLPSVLARYGDPDARVAPINGKEGPVQSVDAFEVEQRAYPGGIPADGYPLGIRQANRMLGPTRSVSWQDLGPTYAPDASSANPLTGSRTPVSGRATAIAVVPSTCSNGACNTIYLGTANGGVWKTTDAGKTWTPLLDHAQSLAVGTIVLDPKNPDIVYVGTGEPNQSGDSFSGIGILRSTDAGRTWTNLGYKQFVNRAVAAIVIDPRTAGTPNATIYAVDTRAASGGATTGGGAARTNPYLPPLGFWTSTDGGKTWHVSTPAPDGAQSLVMDPSDPNVLYVGFNPDINDPNAPGSPDALYGVTGIFKSIDDGKSWVRLAGGLPLTNFESIQLAIAPSNPQIMYASYQITTDYSFDTGGTSSHQEMYRSTDGGGSWTKLANTPDACGDQCEYDMPLVVDPANPDIVYAGGTGNYDYWGGSATECSNLDQLPRRCHVTVMRTTDGGQTWADMSENGDNGPLHPDDHAIVLAPNDPSVVYTVSDGGIFHSADGGKSWNDLNRGLGTLQFTALAVASNGDIYAGTQDNGQFKYSGTSTWQHIEDGDGGPTAVDPKNPQIVYKSYYGPILVRNDHGGDPKYDVFIAPFYGDFFVKNLGQFYEPYQIAPSRPQTIYYGTYRVWRTNMRGGTDGNDDGDATNDSTDKTDWVPISFDLRCNDQPVDPASSCTGGPFFGKGIASIAVSPVNPNVVIAAASNGNIWMTTNALAPVKTDASCSLLTNPLGAALCDYVSGPTWHRIDKGLPKRYPTSVRFAPGSSARIFVTFSGFNQQTSHNPGHIFVTSNAGRSWTNLNGSGARTSLPNLPFNDIIVNPANGHLYVASDYGIYASSNGGRSWSRIDQGLPAVPIYRMDFSASQHAL